MIDSAAATTVVEVAIDETAQYDAVKVRRGDRVVYSSVTDAVLLIHDPTIFGSTRFEIPAGKRVVLIVQDHSSGGDFRCTVLTGNLDANFGDVVVGRNGINYINNLAGGQVDPPD